MTPKDKKNIAIAYLQQGYHLIREGGADNLTHCSVSWGILDFYFQKDDNEVLLELLQMVEKVNSEKLKACDARGYFYYKLKNTKSCYEKIV